MFEQFGYFKEYYIDKKFIGDLKCEKDREHIGYYGTQKEVLNIDIILDNKKKIKVGTEVSTMIYPLCGSVIKQ